MGEPDRKVLDCRANILVQKAERKYDALVKTMIELQEAGGTGGAQVIAETVTDLAKDLSLLFEFAYELRKNDPQNQYSSGFLKGNVNPPVVVDIIMGNTWDSAKQVMTLSQDCEYRMVLPIGQQKFTLVYIKDVSSLPAAEISVPFILNEANAVPANMTPNVKFTLCPGGLKIGHDNVQLEAQTNEKEVDHGLSAPLVVKYSDNDQSAGAWTLKHAGQNAQDPFFFVEVPSGEMRPRLAYQREAPQTSSKLAAISFETSNIKQ